MECCCTVNADIGDTCELISARFIKARKEHKCTECYRVIQPKEEYFREVTVYDGSMETYKTCDDCYSLRQVFFSDGWFYGMLWESMHEFINDCGGELSVPCILDLTKTARDTVLDMIEEEWGDVEICPECEHLVECGWSEVRCTNPKCNYVEPCI